MLGLKLREENWPKLFVGPRAPAGCCHQVLQAFTARRLPAKESLLDLGVEDLAPVPVDWSANLARFSNGSSSCLMAACLSCVSAHWKLSNRLSWQLVLDRLDRSFWEKVKSALGFWKGAFRPERPLLRPPPKEYAIVLNKERFAAAAAAAIGEEVEIAKGFVHLQWPTTNQVMQLLQRYPLVAGVACSENDLDQAALQGQVYEGRYEEAKLTRCVVIAGYDKVSWILLDAYGQGGFFRIRFRDTGDAGICSFVMVPGL